MKALRHMIDRAVRNGADPADRDLPDEVRCAAAIKRLNSAFSTVRSGAGLEAAGLGEGAQIALAALREVKGADRALVNAHRGVFMAIPLDLLHDAVVGVQLPNEDQAILRSLRDQPVRPKGKVELRAKADERLRARLQLCTITLMQSAIKVHNCLKGIDICAISPAMRHEPERHSADIAFTLPFHVLFELFDRTRGSRGFRWNDVANKHQLVFFRYVAEEGALAIFDGSMSLQFSVEPLPAPEPALADMAPDAPRRAIATIPLIEGLDWVSRWAECCDVIQDAGAIVSTHRMRPISFSSPDIEPGRIAIPANVATSLKSVLRRLGRGATIRDDGTHYYIANGVVTLAFAMASARCNDFQHIDGLINENGACLTLDAHALLRGLLFLSAIEADQARIELCPGDPAHLKLSANVINRRGTEDRGVHYVEVRAFTNPNAIVNQSAEIDIASWINILGGRDTELIDIVVSGDRTGVSLKQDHQSRVIHALGSVSAMPSDPHEWDTRILRGEWKDAPSGVDTAQAIATMLVTL